MTQYLAVKNFATFQHYKDRSPPWIKLYNALLDDYSFLSLPDATRGHLMLLWLIASRHDNKIPYDLAYLKRALHTSAKVDLARLIASGFLIVAEHDASTAIAAREHDAGEHLAQRKHAASPRALARVEGEESREESEAETAGAATGFAAAWSAYPRRDGSNPRRDAERAFHARLAEGESAEAMIDGTRRYRAHCEHREAIGTPYVMQAKRFYGPSREYAEPWEVPRDPDELRAERERDAQLADETWIAERIAARELNGATPSEVPR